ncbi:MAG: hypothetical protein A2234_08210 [Elusimicrobia bacterium RIFOXYA2_FULL_58_8]|nr:MAG: hypothetical protein A2285_01345 [Elusimicrobia bacterium RIFOXYA12_FULL_57_11]OGS17059.1 MAG: hypothetical protein A2234_08210 [Elusimicrobia bacterium RIFOXYA2_FULL_58_8]
MPPQVTIIILCHNDKRFLRRCAASVERHTKPGLCEYIMIDNGSRDGAWREISAIKRRSVFPVRMIRNAKNRFFGPANNQGLAAARTPYVLFLNADTVVTPGWLDAMLGALRSDPRLGMVGPMTNSAVGLQLVNTPRAGAAKLPRRGAAVRLVPWIIGFCALMPRALAVRLGGFDELYGPGGYEDYDLCLKTRLAGYEIGVASGSYVHHLGGMGYSGMDYNGMRRTNRELYRAKWRALIRARLVAAKT